MASVIHKVIGQNYETGLQLGTEAWMRKPFFGRTWNRIRIGLVYSFTPAFWEQDLRDLNLYLGLVAGNYPITDPRCDYAVGVCLNGVPGRDQTCSTTYTAGSQPYRPLYSNATGMRGFLQQRESFVTYAGSPTNGLLVVDAGAVSNFMSPIFVDFNRPQATLAGSWTVTVYYPPNNAASLNIGWRQSHMSDALETWSTPTINGITFITTSAAFTIQTSEFAGELDKICVNWSSDAHPITIWAVGASMSYDQTPAYTGYTAAMESFDDYAYSGTLYSGANPSFSGTVETGRWGWTGTGVIIP